MTIDYQVLNKVAPHLAAAVPDMMSLVETISQTTGEWHTVMNLVNALFFIAIGEESQNQFATMWDKKQYTVTVVPQGYLHSPTICHGLLARDLAMLPKLDCKTNLTAVQIHM